MRVYQQEAITMTLSLTAIDCPSCGVVFGITTELEQRRRADGERFYCPNGHWMTYTESELDKARKELMKAKARADQLAAARDEERFRRELTERSLSATKGQVTKLRKRIHAGVCPHCRRHFVALEQHIATKHPHATLEAER